MRIETYELLITVFGLVLTATSFYILISGKKIRGDGQQQRIKITNKVDVSLSSAILLVIMGISVAMAPLFFHWWKIDPKEYIRESEIRLFYKPTITVSGGVSLDGNPPGSKFPIKVIRQRINDTTQSIEYTKTTYDSTDGQGYFEVNLPKACEGERYSIEWTKEGFDTQKLDFLLNKIPHIVYLRSISRGGN